jgi:hypothetical protein
MNKAFFLVLALAAFVTPSAANTTCSAVKIKQWKSACDSVPKPSRNKCNNRACHNALHFLITNQTALCHVKLKLGPVTQLAKYKALDKFCHGEGPEPKK